MGEKNWYVLRTAGTKEKKVADYLRKEVERSKDLQMIVDEILVPVKKEIVTKNGKRKEVERLLFPGYVLIHAELNADLEYIIRGHFIPGLAGFRSEKSGQKEPLRKNPRSHQGRRSSEDSRPAGRERRSRGGDRSQLLHR